MFVPNLVFYYERQEDLIDENFIIDLKLSMLGSEDVKFLEEFKKENVILTV